MAKVRRNPFILIIASVLFLGGLILYIQTSGSGIPAGEQTRTPDPRGSIKEPLNTGFNDIINRISLPPGFSISIYATDIPGARSLACSANGTLFVGTRGDKVYAVRDVDRDGTGETVTVVASDLNMPNGVTLHDGDLYVAEVQRILRYPNIEAILPDTPDPEIVSDEFPSDIHHGWKFIRFGPDGMLYVPVGVPCNICLPPDERYAAIHRMYPDGSGHEIFASGIRNSVGFDWDPKTGDLWFTDNGRDYLGDDLPPDELNYAPEKGSFFGYPYHHGKDIVDPEFGLKAPDACRNCTPAAQELGPHVASLGIRFYTGSLFPSEFSGSIFIAEHGSWNRKDPIGYRVTEVRLRNGTPVSYNPFIEGWLHDGTVLGRPVDLEVMPDGSLLISDDMNGVVYRVRYEIDLKGDGS